MTIFGGKCPGAEVASHLSVGDGAVSEAGDGVLRIGKLIPGMWVGIMHVLHNIQSQTRTENQTCFRRSACKKKLVTQPVERVPRRASMHWGVECITDRADVYAMMMGALTDDQIRQPSLNR